MANITQKLNIDINSSTTKNVNINSTVKILYVASAKIKTYQKLAKSVKSISCLYAKMHFIMFHDVHMHVVVKSGLLFQICFSINSLQKNSNVSKEHDYSAKLKN